MSDAIDTDGPLPYEYKGKTYYIPKATSRDYLPWLAELHEKTKAADRALVPAAMAPKDRFNLFREIEKNKPTHWTLVEQLNASEGVERVLNIVLDKAADMPPDVKEHILNLTPDKQRKLACYASGLIPDARLSLMYGPSQEDLEAQALQLLTVFTQAMVAAGISMETIRKTLLNMPGITPELLDGTPAEQKTEPEQIATFATAAGGAWGNSPSPSKNPTG